MSDARAVPFPVSRRIPELDGLRAIAVLLVVLLHFYVRVPVTGSRLDVFLHQLFGLSFCGVDLFFVLSGFLIGGILIDHRDAPNLYGVFYWRRFLRILPAYLLLLASFQVGRAIPSLAALNYSTYFASPVPVWSYWFFVQNIAMAWSNDLGSYWLAPTWSLGVEEQFYLAMPLLVRLLSRRSLACFCGCVIVLSPVLRTLAWHQSDNGLAAIFLTPMRADALMLGVACAVLLRSPMAARLQQHRSKILVTTLALGAALLGLSFCGVGAVSPAMIIAGYSLAAWFFAGCLLLALLNPSASYVRWLASRPLARLGLISYFVYLAHQPVWFAAHWLIRGQAPSHATLAGCGVTVGAFGLTLLLGELSWRTIESPLLVLARRATYRS